MTELIEEQTGKGKRQVDSGGGQGQDGGSPGSSAVQTFGGGKKAKVGVFAVPDVQTASGMAETVNIYEYVCALCSSGRMAETVNIYEYVCALSPSGIIP